MMLGNGVNIGVLSKILGHASIQVTLDSYVTYHDQFVISNINMIRKKLVAKNEKFEIKELIVAQDELVQNFMDNNHTN